MYTGRVTNAQKKDWKEIYSDVNGNFLQIVLEGQLIPSFAFPDGHGFDEGLGTGRVTLPRPGTCLTIISAPPLARISPPSLPVPLYWPVELLPRRCGPLLLRDLHHLPSTPGEVPPLSLGPPPAWNSLFSSLVESQLCSEHPASPAAGRCAGWEIHPSSPCCLHSPIELPRARRSLHRCPAPLPSLCLLWVTQPRAKLGPRAVR